MAVCLHVIAVKKWICHTSTYQCSRLNNQEEETQQKYEEIISDNMNNQKQT